ncbi:MAG: hypothetical protein ISN29_10885 [Gammaproteobacteria bacterium AqS3]|nr:hypothetical protein [Gammaproteobacteria bacterium AqS3]
MCLIIDANMFDGYIKQKDANMQQLKFWVENKSRRVAYSNAGKMKQELARNPEMMEMLFAYRESEKAELFSEEEIKRQEETLQEYGLKSDDEHILALALASGARLLVSEDRALGVDFKAHPIRGKVYKNQNRQRREDLLRECRCPPKKK